MVIECVCEEEGIEMTLIQTDSRQEWCEEIYECPKCDKIKIHRTDYDQRGLVISDTIEGE